MIRSRGVDPAGSRGNGGKDGLVVVEGANDYASKVPAANLTTAVAIEAVPTHCGFTNAEVLASWESLSRSGTGGSGNGGEVGYGGPVEPFGSDPTLGVPTSGARPAELRSIPLTLTTGPGEGAFPALGSTVTFRCNRELRHPAGPSPVQSCYPREQVVR
jgi:hypothetical protein